MFLFMSKDTPGVDKTVGVVDDDESVLHYLGDTLASGGYDCRLFGDGPSALDWLNSGEEHPDLVLSEVNMARMNGLDLLHRARAASPDVPFILVSGKCDLPSAQGALRAGAADYLLKPIRPEDLVGLVSKHLDIAHSEKFASVRDELQRSFESKELSEAKKFDRLLPIFNALGFKRFETLQHSRRVAAFTLLIARDLGLDQDTLSAIETGALLHDIGKAGIPHNVLFKPGKLNETEATIMKMHPLLGLDLLSGVSGLDLEAQIVCSHHERFDGTGYPHQLVGEAIPLSARIFSIADTLDAITSNRCYRPGQPLSVARAEIHRAAGPQFDPMILHLFDRVSDEEFEAVRRRFPDVSD
jgi:putative nucleotidyltransferase with HDIG domain